MLSPTTKSMYHRNFFLRMSLQTTMRACFSLLCLYSVALQFVKSLLTVDRTGLENNRSLVLIFIFLQLLRASARFSRFC